MMSWRPLDGIFVLDLTQLLPGPFATRVLADLGATVLSIEPPDGDAARRMPPVIDGDGWVHRALAAGKESVRIDLKTPDGLEAVRRLARHADVLLESNRPGVLERLGLAPADLQSSNPGLVVVRLTGYGQTGPMRGRSGHDLTYEALSGTLWLNGPEDRPIPPAMPAADVAGALYAVVGILAALRGRGISGQGRVLDISLYESALAVASPYLVAAAAGHVARRGADPLLGGLAGYNVYECGDGRWIALAALEPRFFAKACEVIGRPEWSSRIGDATLRRDFADAFSKRFLNTWLEAFEAADVPAAPVLAPDEVLAHQRAHGRSAEPLGPGGPLSPEGPEPRSVRSMLESRGVDPAEIDRFLPSR